VVLAAPAVVVVEWALAQELVMMCPRPTYFLQLRQESLLAIEILSRVGDNEGTLLLQWQGKPHVS